MNVTPQSPSESASDYAYRVLRDNIIRIILEPGARISAAEVAEELRVSRTPIQNAFSRLVADGLLNVFSQRGSYVSIIDLKRVYESVYLRNLVDQAAVHYFCRCAHNEQAILQLEENLARQRFYLQNGIEENSQELDDEFHAIIYQFCGMEIINNVLRTISADQQRMRYVKLYSNIRRVETFNEHVEMLAALKERNEEKACSVCFSHLSHFGPDIDTVYRERPDYFTNWNEDFSLQFACRSEMFCNMDRQ